MKSRQWVLANRPAGWPSETDFRLEEVDLPEPIDGEIAVETAWLSVDPYMRSRMRDAPSYAPPVELGAKMTGAGVGRVVASRSPRFAEGDWVEGVTGWCSALVGEAKNYRKLDPAQAPVQANLGVLGAPGLTAYFGVLDVCKAKSGETMVVSGGAGAVGSVAGQIAKIAGCRVVGIAGTADKVTWITGELGFDAAFNYKETTDYRGALTTLCPGGIDTYFDNVGGAITDAVIPRLNVHARVAVCGQISMYNDEKPEPGPRFLWHLITKRARLEGFLVLDYRERFREARAQLAAWLQEGRLRSREEVREGLEATPRAFLDMMRGANTGKMLVRVG
jgi:NADPH-dependent curcumin reductase CurA